MDHPFNWKILNLFSKFNNSKNTTSSYSKPTNNNTLETKKPEVLLVILEGLQKQFKKLLGQQENNICNVLLPILLRLCVKIGKLFISKFFFIFYYYNYNNNNYYYYYFTFINW